MANRVVLAVTGSRPNKLKGGYDNYSEDNIRMMKFFADIMYSTLDLNEHVHCISGGALGADTIWAISVLNMRILHPDRITLEMAIPFKNQDGYWPDKSRHIYQELLKKADTITNVSGKDNYKPQYMQDRNIYMVDNCHGLIAIYNNTSGGTNNCIKYARSKGKRILINDTFHK